VIGFRVRPDPDRPEYYEIRVYPTLKAMRAALRRKDRRLGRSGTGWDRTAGCCVAFTRQRMAGRRWISLPQLGIVYLCRPRLGAGAVAHELAHAAVNWARRRGISGRAVWGGVRNDLESAANERFAAAVGELNRQFWNAWHAGRRRRA